MCTWNSDYSVNVGILDEEHKKLFKLTDDLAKAIDNVKGELLAHTIYELVAYASIHFANEEQLLEANEYPVLEQRKEEHQKFKVHIRAFIFELSDDNEALAKEILDFLRGWLVGHIMGEDKKYSHYLNERGIS